MADQKEIHSLALHEILLSISDSLDLAQTQLNNMPPYDRYGRPNTIYHLPYLDFSLKVLTEFQENVETTKDSKDQPPGKRLKTLSGLLSRQALLFKSPAPVKASSTSSTNKAQIESTISGRFVAVIPNENEVQIRLLCTSTMPVLSANIYKFSLEAELKNVNDEAVSRMPVEFNFDEGLTLTLNNLNSIASPKFSAGEVWTDEDGKAVTEVEIKKNDWVKAKDGNPATFVFTVSMGSLSTSIAVSQS